MSPNEVPGVPENGDWTREEAVDEWIGNAFQELTDMFEAGKAQAYDFMVWAHMFTSPDKKGQYLTFEWSDFDWTGLSRSQVKRSLRLFEKLGVLSVRGGHRPKAAVCPLEVRK